MFKILLFLAVIGFSSCGAVGYNCDLNGHSSLCGLLEGPEKVSRDDYEDDKDAFLQNDYCSVEQEDFVTLIDCPESQAVIDTAPNVEVINPCEGSKEVLLKVGEEFVAYFSSRGGFLSILEENVTYRTTDGRRCVFQINNL